MSKEAIDKARAEITKGWLNCDAEAILNNMTEDAMFLGAHEQPVKGASAIREWLAGFFSQVKMTNLPQSEDREVIVSGDLAVERSSYDWEWIVVGSDEPVTDQGTFIGIWRRQSDGSWKESHIMWHSWNPAG
jgi:uncharacterized protein (TIGR02246 family)